MALDGVEAWVFDLDNTIYPARSGLFLQVARRMTGFIMEKFNLEEEPARDLQKRLFRQYGTTMAGLMREYDMPPDEFLHFVHDIDLSSLDHDSMLDAGIGKLPGRKVIFTNGTTRHAERILDAYGISHHFDFIYDIYAADHQPKPNPAIYDDMLARTGINPQRAVMIEDMAVNLKPAAALGMTTLWLEHELDWARKGVDEGFVHFHASDLKDFLAHLKN